MVVACVDGGSVGGYSLVEGAGRERFLRQCCRRCERGGAESSWIPRGEQCQ